MRALAWLNKLRRNESGNVLAITAASMPLILGGAAMAIDTIQLSVWKRQLQRAADSAAIAGAYAEARGDVAEDAVHRDLDENTFPTLSQPEVVLEGPRLGFNRTVYVSLTAERRVPFLSFFTNRANTLTVDATAALVDDGQFCMLSLFDEEEGAGIDANGGALVDLDCGMYSHSRDDDSGVTAGGNSSIKATPVSTVGALDSDQNFAPGTTLRPYSAPMADPFANVPLPTLPEADCDEVLSVAKNDPPLTINANNNQACWGAWDVDGTVFLEPGVYYINGGDVDINGRVESIGEGGVTIILTATETNDDGELEAGEVLLNGGGNLVIEARDTGDYRGIALYRDPRAELITVKLNGGAETEITGAIYMPGTDLWLGGNTSFNATCLQVVARIITFRGAADIGNECDADGGAQMFRQTVVRLVG